MAKRYREFTMEHVAEITNRFREIIGEAGYWKVFRGYMGNKQVAVKRYTTGGDQTKIQRYEDEVKLLKKLTHESIVGFIGYASGGHERAIVLELMPKQLDSNQIQALSWKDTKEVLLDVSTALRYLHSQGYAYNDIKPDNIMLDEGMKAKLIDFRAASQINKDAHVFTDPYRAPERNPSGKGTEASDVYGFGILMLQLLRKLSPEETHGREKKQRKGRPKKKEIFNKKELKLENLRTIAQTEVDQLNHHILHKTLTQEGGCNDATARNLTKFAIRCSSGAPRARPSMNEVVNFLHNI